MKKETITYCVMCLYELEHTYEEDSLICSNCGNPACDGILDRDEQIENLSYENKMMAEKLESLGFSQEQISNICSGGKEEHPKLLTPYIKELEETESTTYLDGDIVVHVYNSTANDGYMVERFPASEVSLYMEDMESGLCTGSAKDAVSFLS
jgi:hypothetical protein